MTPATARARPYPRSKPADCRRAPSPLLPDLDGPAFFCAQVGRGEVGMLPKISAGGLGLGGGTKLKRDNSLNLYTKENIRSFLKKNVKGPVRPGR